MDFSVFLAQVIGINLLILSLSILSNGKQFHAITDELSERPSLSFLIGMVLLVAGSLLVLSHNVWESSWVLVVTITSWLIFLKGVIYLMMPGLVRKISKEVLQENPALLYVGGVANLVLGLYFCYMGFLSSVLLTG
tara:strand:- start:719 stop:1126 length:408 start_codon:yes stop_codon:yes gene_type:complete